MRNLLLMPMLDRLSAGISGAGRKRLVSFGAVVVLEGVSQTLTLLTAFVVIRTLSVEDYGVYSIAFSIVGLMSVLSESGMSSGISALLGKHWRDQTELARIVRTAILLRTWVWLAVVPIAVFMLGTMLWAKLSFGRLFILGALTFLISYVGVTGTLLGMVPLFIGKRVQSQILQVVNGLTRLLVIATLSWGAMGGPVAYTFAGLLAALVSLVGLERIIRYREMKGASPSPEYQSELRRVMKRLLPNAFFYAFQGQITTVVLAWFGTLHSVGSASALARIGLGFALVTRVSGLYLAPSFAKKTDMASARRFFIRSSAVTFGISASIAGFFALMPQLILSILGQQYAGLEAELRLAILAAMLNCWAAVIWQLLAARALVSKAWLYIPVSLGVQIIAVVCWDVTNLGGVLLMAVATNAANFLLQMIQAWRLVFKRSGV